MDLRNGQPMIVEGYPPGIRAFPSRKDAPANYFGRDARGLGVRFEACASIFERCAERHDGCRNCPAASNGCLTLWEKAVCSPGAKGQLSHRQMMRLQDRLEVLSASRKSPVSQE